MCLAKMGCKSSAVAIFGNAQNQAGKRQCILSAEPIPANRSEGGVYPYMLVLVLYLLLADVVSVPNDL